MSFRIRLFLAMLGLVAAVAGSTLWVAGNHARDRFERALDSRFAERVASQASLRELQLEIGSRAARAIARSIRLQAAMIEYADDPQSGTDVYANAEMALGMGEEDVDSALLVFDSEGMPIGRERVGDVAGLLAWRPPPEAIRMILKSGDEVRGTVPTGRSPGWLEAVFVPVRSTADDELLGALLYARRGRSPTAGTGEYPAALILDGRFVGHGWPAAAGPLLLPLVSGETGRKDVVLDGKPYAVFWRRLGGGARVLPAAWEISGFSLEEHQRELQAMRSMALGAGAFAVCISAGIAMLLAGGLSRPIGELVKATNAVRAGDYSVRAPVARGEFGILAEAFNAMTADLTLKEKYRLLLDLVSDPHVAEDLLESGLELGGEDREVSVVYCDIRGFTTLSEGMEPREVIEMLNEHFTPLTAVVYAHDGVVLHFVGDLLIALFGAPKHMPKHQRAAASCALGMIAERTRMNEEGGRQISVGVGVATGHMVAGRMGSKNRLNYSVLGARMNLAARLCSQAGPMQIVVDGATVEGCSGAAIVRSLGGLRLKGISGTTEAFELQALDREESDFSSSESRL